MPIVLLDEPLPDLARPPPPPEPPERAPLLATGARCVLEASPPAAAGNRGLPTRPAQSRRSSRLHVPGKPDCDKGSDSHQTRSLSELKRPEGQCEGWSSEQACARERRARLTR